jgi:hypothetical protein
MDAITFDDLESAGSSTWRKPFFAIDYGNESEVFEWLKAEFRHLKSTNWRRHEKIRNHYLRYKGIQYENQFYQNRRSEPETQRSYQPQMVIPLIRDMIDERVARLLEQKPSISVLPVHDEERDKVDAKIAKRFLQHIDYTEKLNPKWNKFLKNAKIAGESFMFITWNPDKGPMHPKFKKGMVIDGKVYNDGVHIGDVDIRPVSPLWVYYEEPPSKSWDDVNYLFLVEYEYVEKLKKDYPSKESSINADVGGARVFDFERMEEMDMLGRTAKVTFWHKKCKYLPEGFEACFTDTVLLKMGESPYKDNHHCGIPAIRIVGIENEEELHGESAIEPVRGIASQVTNQYNMAIKQFMLCAYPKWFVEGASVDHQQLNNDVGIVTIKAGGKAPVLAQPNPVSPQLLDFTSRLRDDFYAFGKSNSVVRGDPPSQVGAFVAMQYLSESENRRLNTEVMQLNEAIKDCYDMILKVCGQFYKKDDERTMWVIGKGSQFLTSKYDPSSLAKPYNVVLQNQGAFPDSRSARTQLVLDTASMFPDLLPKEQVIEMLGLAQSEKLMDISSAAARAAEDENEWMLDGKGMIEPEPHEDLIVHWRIHTMAIQDIGFKTKLAPEIQQTMKDHIMATEMLMLDQAQRNPAFGQMLQTLVMFPMFFSLPPALPIPAQEVPQEEMGEPINPETIA